MADAHRTLREGVTAGVLGATAVAAWFLLVDGLSGQPFATPTMLGQSLASVVRAPIEGNPATYVLVYTLFHYAAFAAVGTIVAAVVSKAELEPSVLVGLFILFVAFEVGWYGLTALLSGSAQFGRLAWYQVMLANLIAAAVMGTYFYRTHPGLARRFAHSLAGGE
jgi:hypothetical protein